VDLLQQGIRAAADTAESVIINTAAAAAGGIEAAASLSQQGLTAAEGAAEDTVRNINAAAQGTLNAAAATVGGAAGVVDGVTQSAASGSRARQGSNGGRGVTSTSDFDTVNVRVPGTAWANATPEKGRVRDATLTQDFDEDEVCVGVEHQAFQVSVLSSKHMSVGVCVGGGAERGSLHDC